VNPMKVLMVDNHSNPREEMTSMITDHLYWVPDPSGRDQSGDLANVSLHSRQNADGLGDKS
jgi:hypothetical protein